MQGAGKSTLVKRLCYQYPQYQVFHEGDYSPVELAWCAYVDEPSYWKIVETYSELRDEIEKHTVSEGVHKIICYTQIKTEVEEFYKELERYEIYNGNYRLQEFEEIISSRLEKWDGKDQIFECSIFQNIIENLMLYLELSDEQILAFYQKIAKLLKEKEMKILYLNVEDIRSGIDVIKRERCDAVGKQVWYQMMIEYIENAPYSKKHGLKGMDGLITHLERRRELELRIINEFFQEKAIVLQAKQYDFAMSFLQ